MNKILDHSGPDMLTTTFLKQPIGKSQITTFKIMDFIDAKGWVEIGVKAKNCFCKTSYKKLFVYEFDIDDKVTIEVAD